MKIINVYNGDFINSSQGGGMRYIRDLIAAQYKRGYEIELLAVGQGKARDIAIGGVPVYYVPISSTLRWPNFLLGLLMYLAKNKQRYEGNIIHLHRIYFCPPFRILVKNSRVVVTIHTKTFSVLIERFPIMGYLLPMMLAIEKLLIKTCVDKLSAAGNYAVELYEKRHNIDRNNITLLCGPSNFSVSNEPDPILSDDPRKNILCVGRISTVKRPLSVLKLFQKATQEQPSLIKTHRLIYIGEGEAREKLESEITHNKLQKHVKILGSIDAERMPRIYAAGACLILLSSSETGPFTVKEALTSGIPVFATNVGNVNNYVSAECGITIPKDNPELNSKQFIDFLHRRYDSEACANRAEIIRKKETSLFERGLSIIYS